MSSLDPSTHKAGRAFLKAAATVFPVSRGLVFGSRARGMHRPDSDADIAVFLTGQPQSLARTKLAMADMAYDILLETGILIQPLPIWESQWSEEGGIGSHPLFSNIAREGIEI